MARSKQYQQSKKWERACLDTRRSLGSRKKRLAKFRISSGLKVLDLGCGDGLNTNILFEQTRNIVGVDISGDLIKIARMKNPRVKFYIGTAEKIPLRANQFDVVLVDSVFHHILDYKKAVGEIKRVLISGGVLCFIEPDNSLIRRFIDYLCTLKVSKYMPILNKRRITYLEEKDLMEHWLGTKNEFLNVLKKYNFRKIFLNNDFLSIVGKYKVKK